MFLVEVYPGDGFSIPNAFYWGVCGGNPWFLWLSLIDLSWTPCDDWHPWTHWHACCLFCTPCQHWTSQSKEWSFSSKCSGSIRLSKRCSIGKFWRWVLSSNWVHDRTGSPPDYFCSEKGRDWWCWECLCPLSQAVLTVALEMSILGQRYIEICCHSSSCCLLKSTQMHMITVD